MASEEVHAGLRLAPSDAADIAAFLDDSTTPLPIIDRGVFASPQFCAACHPRQYDEWQGTMMSYGAMSPCVQHARIPG